MLVLYPRPVLSVPARSCVIAYCTRPAGGGRGVAARLSRPALFLDPRPLPGVVLVRHAECLLPLTRTVSTGSHKRKGRCALRPCPRAFHPCSPTRTAKGTQRSMTTHSKENTAMTVANQEQVQEQKQKIGALRVGTCWVTFVVQLPRLQTPVQNPPFAAKCSERTCIHPLNALSY